MSTLPREDRYRACYPAAELRGDFGTETPPLMAGHFSIFDSPTEIDSLREGNFLETIARGAFRKTFAENRDNIKVLFQHGRDPQIGDKPLGAIQDLREDDIGAYYEVPLIDTSYNRDLLPGLRAGLYGASFRFQVLREDIKKNPGESPTNPRGIPERVVREASVSEFSAVTFPAYKDATAGVRSITDTVLDVDALAYAGAIVFDQERMHKCQAFISRGVDSDKDAEPTLEPFTAVDPPAETVAVDRAPIVAMRERLAEIRDTTLPAESVDALGSLIEVCESSLEAMEDLLGIEDDAEDLAELQADMAEDMGETNSADPAGDVRRDPLESETQDAPPVDSAEPSLAHPIRGRRDTSKSYLRKEKPSWQL